MSLTNDEVFERLSAPIPPEQIRSRKGSQGRDLLYIQMPTVVDRLDSACGPANWWNEMEMAEHYVKCRLSIRLPDGQVLTREGIGGYPEMPTEEDKVKGGATDALKRVAALFGVGLNLYEDAAPQQNAQARPPARQAAPPQRQGGGWGAGQSQGQAPRPPQRQGGGNGGNYGPPRTGRALFAYAKDRDCVNDVNAIGKRMGLGGKMVDWPAGDVQAVYAELTGEVEDEPAHAAAGHGPPDDDIEPAF